MNAGDASPMKSQDHGSEPFDGTEHDDAASAVGDDLRIELLEMQLRLFETRDFAIGASARAGEMQARLTTKEIELANALTVNHENDIHIENHLAHIARLEAALAAVEPQIRELNARAAQLDRVYASVTWRLGKFLMLPVRLIRRIVRRS
jgi:hypothetical protein